MCGFAGFVGFKGLEMPPQAVAEAMGNAIRHRGPDDWGCYVDTDADVALVHRRLSIVDLSAAGHQPMHGRDGRFVIVFNGEIYNHAEIRARLDAEGGGIAWRGRSDTEVLLEAISAWGLERALELSVGMFALAVFDRTVRRLQLARDRLGEKPLYFGRFGGVFGFASEIKALRRHPAFGGNIDRGALALFMRYNNVPAPYSIYQGIRKLSPGAILTLDLRNGREAISRYWDPVEVAERGVRERFEGTAEAASEKVEALLTQSIKGQMVADVPLGAFLSGGIDSSTVVALMQKLSTRPVRTFSVGFHVEGYDEAQHAKAVARHLGTDHTELYVTERDALDVIPRLPEIYCEPFADSSQIPTFLVSRLARQTVTVSLSGDGGDELFAGYTRYGLAQSTWRWLSRIPRFARQGLGRAALAVPPGVWDGAARVVPGPFRPGRFGDRVHKAAPLLGARGLDDVYLALVSQWQIPERLVLGAKEPQLPRVAALGSDMRRMMLDDLVRYLPGDILVKVDRAAMAMSLETRVPMLDHRLIEFASSLPDQILRSNGQSKWPLRQILYRHVPRALVERPKMGFGVPIDRWLRGKLRDWAEDLLGEHRLRCEGYLDPSLVRKVWASHLSGRENHQHQLWCVLMFQAWLTNEKLAST